MALNLSSRHFSSHLSEENKVSPMKIAAANVDMFSHCFDSPSVDILDILPSDPFGMDINNTFTAITGWLEDLKLDYECDNIGIADGNHQLLAGLGFIWNNAMQFQEFPQRSSSSRSDHCTIGGENVNVHPAFGFCLYHLGVKDLLSVSMVCKSLHTIVRDDSLLWKHIHICRPLNEKITEDALLHLAEKAQGRMQCLKLVDCLRITDDCLERVLKLNPQIVKLSLSGCTRMSIIGVMRILRDLKSTGKLRVKHLEIGGLFGVTKDLYEELFDLLEIDSSIKQTIRKQRFYHRRRDSYVSSCDDDQVLDIEKCPKCQNTRLVYDCPAEDCKGKEECRGCSLCIQRCFKCGRCINDSEYEETFCLDYLCYDCSKPSAKLPPL